MSDLPSIAVLAGGLATRLRPITTTIPKSLVPVAGQPFIVHQLRLLHRQGFRRVVLLIGHLGEQIRQVIGDGSGFDLQVEYAEDGPAPRGTGGAIRNAMSMMGDACFVMYGDSYLPVDCAPVWQAFRRNGLPALMTVLHNHDRWDPSNIRFDGNRVLCHDKRLTGTPGIEWIDYGLSVFATETIRHWPDPDPFDLSTLTGALAERGLLGGFAVQTRFYEIGKPAGLAETEALLQAGSPPLAGGLPA